VAQSYIKVFYGWPEETQELTFEEKGRLIDAMIAYARGNPVHLEGNERFVFPVFRAQIDRDTESYNAIVERNRINGSKGGRPKRNPENPEGYPGTGKRQDKEQDKDEDKGRSSSESADTIEIYASANLDYLSPSNMEDLVAFRDDLPEDLIRHAIDEACANGKRSWAYARSILARYQRAGYRSVEEAKAAAAHRAQQQGSMPATAQPQIRWVD